MIKLCPEVENHILSYLHRYAFNPICLEYPRSKIGKKKVLSESELKEMVMPQEGELLGRVIKLVGGDNIIVKCTDGKVRTCRIRGKIKRRMWIRDNDLVLVAPWDFKSDRADIIWRYISAHAEKMKADGLLQGLD